MKIHAMNDQLWAFCDPSALVQMKKNATIVPNIL